MKRPLEEENQCPAETEAKDLGKKLSDLIKHKKKFSAKRAKVFITLDELKSLERSYEDRDENVWKLPLFYVQDIQRVILFSLIGNQYRFFPRWCKILRPNHIKRVHLMTINNFSEYDYKANEKLFKKFNKLFTNEKERCLNSVEFVSPFANCTKFLNEFSSVPITRTQWLKIRDESEFQRKRNEVVDKYKRIFQKTKTSKLSPSQATESKSTSSLDKIPRSSLLMSLKQMVREDYPLPFDQSGTHRLSEYVFTKDSYLPVDNTSPLFSIDCEMCYNEDGEMETVWLALVNESLECVYETFIKPKKRINNYLTNITGVSAKTLQDVTTQLEDVQAKIKEILPANAIICGQSLNNDLHSIKMFHPYVIDTSIIFNLSGNRDIKPSLKRLSVQFLGKLIQEGSHNPTIDAKASIQLVLLKLRQSLEFGDVIVNGCVNIYDDENIESTVSNMTIEDIDLSDPASISKFIYQTGLNIDQNLFSVLRDNKISNAYIDSKYESQDMPINYKHLYETNEEGFQLVEKFANSETFVFSQFYIEKDLQSDKDQLKKLINSIRQVYANLSDDSLFMVAFTGRSDAVSSASDDKVRDGLHKGRCFLKFKCEAMDELEAEVKELYDLVNNGNKKDTDESNKIDIDMK